MIPFLWVGIGTIYIHTMPSKLRTPSPPHIVSKNAKIDPEVHCLDPDGDVDLILTRFVTFEYDEAPKADDSSQSSCETGSDSSALTTPSFTLIDGRIDDGPCEEGERHHLFPGDNLEYSSGIALLKLTPYFKKL